MADSTGTLVSTLEQWSALQIERVQKSEIKDTLIPLPGDASTRHYYRLHAKNDKSYIVAYSPPEQEKNHAFLTLAHDWLQKGIRTPVVFAFNPESGFFLLEDLGPDTLLPVLQAQPERNGLLYQQAMSILHRIQTATPPENMELPRFDTAFIRKEISLFNTWVADALLKKPLSGNQKETVDLTLNRLIHKVMEQPYVMMHRDYHSRNLIPMEDTIGVLDFQDAVTGPVTYDVVSLLRDCYIDWPQTQVYQWLDDFCQYTLPLKQVSKTTIHRWFDMTGLQRHLKVAGIFVRHFLQNNNPFYLPYLPRIFSYIHFVITKYSDLNPLGQWIEQDILPELVKQPWWQPHQLME